MSNRGTTGAAGRMLIARGLHALLTRSGQTQSAVAKTAGVSVGTVARYLGWQDRARLRVPTMRAIAEACGATDAERDGLVQLVTDQGAGWWMDDPAVPEVLDPLVSFERYAAYEHVWASQLVPGLLQTPEYALALHQSSQPRADADTIRARVDARMRRQDVLGDLHLWVVLKESILRDLIGGPKVMADQLGHLIDASREPHITLQVLPRHVGHVAGTGGGPFVILGREDTPDPMATMAVVYLELHRRGLYLDDTKDVGEYKIMFDHLRSEAENADRSRTLMDEARQEHAQ